MRIISLVPSITETLFDFGLSEREIVGRTKFCIHPEESVRKVEVIGGTKNIKTDKIRNLKPDLIIANKEENVKEQVEELRRDFDVWVTEIDTLDDNREFLAALGKRLDKEETAREFIRKTDEVFSSLQTDNSRKAAYLIWQNPYMAVGSETFINEVMEKIGFSNIFAHLQRYPEVQLKDFHDAEYILLSTEPFPFKDRHVQELQKLFPEKKVLLVDGEAFSWYGTRLSKCGSYYKKTASL